MRIKFTDNALLPILIANTQRKSPKKLTIGSKYGTFSEDQTNTSVVTDSRKELFKYYTSAKGKTKHRFDLVQICKYETS